MGPFNDYINQGLLYTWTDSFFKVIKIYYNIPYGGYSMGEKTVLSNFSFSVTDTNKTKGTLVHERG